MSNLPTRCQSRSSIACDADPSLSDLVFCRRQGSAFSRRTNRSAGSLGSEAFRGGSVSDAQKRQRNQPRHSAGDSGKAARKVRMDVYNVSLALTNPKELGKPRASTNGPDGGRLLARQRRSLAICSNLALSRRSVDLLCYAVKSNLNFVIKQLRRSGALPNRPELPDPWCET